MNIMYIGDIMGETGLRLVETLLAGLRRQYQLDMVIAQAENVTGGRGISLGDYNRLRQAGVDFCTGGNWSLHRPEIVGALGDPSQPIIRPANYPAGTPGSGYKYFDSPRGKVLVVSLLGQVVGRDADKPFDNPLRAIDAILEQERAVARTATIVNFHGDYSSEKVIIGHYLDGRVSAVVGDHWHVPTADARVLPGGTAHMTDVGMCGVLNASLGISLDSVTPRWRDGIRTRNALETEGPLQFCAAIVNVDTATALSRSIVPIRIVAEQ